MNRLIFAHYLTKSKQKLTRPDTKINTDFSRVNTKLTEYPGPIPNVEDLITWATKKQVYSSIDLTRGYWQSELDEESKSITAFISDEGLFEWNRVPMGIQQAAGFFQHVMQTHILGDIHGDACVIYIDDCLIASD